MNWKEKLEGIHWKEVAIMSVLLSPPLILLGLFFLYTDAIFLLPIFVISGIVSWKMMRWKKPAEEPSEFGMGLAYCLGLFLAHERAFEESKRYMGEMQKEVKEEMKKAGLPTYEHDSWAEIWFNGASDHVYDLQVMHAPIMLRGRLETFKDKVLNWGHGFNEKGPTKDDVAWALQEAKDLLRLLDQAHGVPTKKGQWE